ncbi:calcium-activated chloride channel regulator 1-like [Glandiceps talaboti]
MGQHEDFKDGNNPPRSIQDTTPTFRIVRTGTRRVVLVLDTSGSMSGSRIKLLHLYATQFIEEFVDDGSMVGIVKFSGNNDEETRILAEMTQITNAIDRRWLSERVPTTTDSATSIGAGLLKALELLQDSEIPTGGASILLITDGGETSPPYISDVIGDVHDAGIRIDTLAYTQSAAEQLRELSEDSGGHYYYSPEEEYSISLMDSLASSITSTPMDNYEAISVMIESNIMTMSPDGSEYTGVVFVDPSIGKNTTFTFIFSSTLLDVTVYSPSGNTIDHNYAGYSRDYVTRKVVIKIADIAEIGKWQYVIQGSATTQTVILLAQSRVRSYGTDPISVEGYLSLSLVNYTEDPKVSVMADVKKGLLPVLDADVTAILDRPTGGTVSITLSDNGAGADLLKGDGIYSSFFLDFSPCSGTCRYGVKIKVSNDDNTARIISYDESVSRALLINEVSENIENVTTVPAEPFNRAISGGAFDVHGGPKLQVENDSQPIDVFPPSRVQDLRVVETFHENSTIVLTWTAVGDDYDRGIVAEYDLRMSNGIRDLYDDFYNTYKITDDDLLLGSLTTPQISGSREVIAVLVNSTSQNMTYAFRIGAVDESGLKGKLSNVVFTLFSFPATTPPTTVTSTTSTSDTTYTSTTTVTTESHDADRSTEPQGSDSIVSVSFSDASSTTVTMAIKSHDGDRSPKSQDVRSNVYAIVSAVAMAVLMITAVLFYTFCRRGNAEAMQQKDNIP